MSTKSNLGVVQKTVVGAQFLFHDKVMHPPFLYIRSHCSKIKTRKNPLKFSVMDCFS